MEMVRLNAHDDGEILIRLYYGKFLNTIVCYRKYCRIAPLDPPLPECDKKGEHFKSNFISSVDKKYLLRIEEYLKNLRIQSILKIVLT